MKLKLLPLLPIALVTVLLTSCGGSASDVPVPEDAALVVHWDGASINSKLSWDDIKQAEWMKQFREDAKDSMTKKLLENPEETGIDIKSDAFFFVVARGKGGYVCMTGKLTDESKFEAFIKHGKQGVSVVKQDGLSVVKDDDNLLTWKSGRFVFVADAPDVNDGQKSFRSGGDRYNFPQDSLMMFAKNVHDMKKKNSLADNSRFTAMLKEKGDIHFWFDGGQMSAGSMKDAAIMLPKLATLSQGNYTAATLNFEEGRIVADAKSYYNKELAAIYKKLKLDNLDESMLKKIPSSNVAGVLAIKYPPEAIKEFTTFLGVDGFINMFLGKAGYSIEEFVKANKGDLMLAFTDFGLTQKTVAPQAGEVPQMGSKPEFKLLVAASINDRPAFDKMLSVVDEQLGKLGGSTVMSKFPHQVKDNWFIAGNDSAAVNAYGSTATDHAFISKISGHPMGGYIDIQKILVGLKAGIPTVDTLTPNIIGESQTGLIDGSAKYWQDIVFYGGEFKDDAMVSHLEINMVDKKTNSLKQLYNYIGVIANNFLYMRLKAHKDLDIHDQLHPGEKADTTAVVPK